MGIFRPTRFSLVNVKWIDINAHGASPWEWVEWVCLVESVFIVLNTGIHVLMVLRLKTKSQRMEIYSNDMWIRSVWWLFGGIMKRAVWKNLHSMWPLFMWKMQTYHSLIFRRRWSAVSRNVLDDMTRHLMENVRLNHKSIHFTSLGIT